MAKQVVSRREFLERKGIMGGPGAAYYGMTKFGFLLVVSVYYVLGP